MQKKILPLLAATVATTIYGLNHTIAKMVMPIYIGSLGLVLLRVLGATIIFWTIGLFFKSKPIEKKDRFTIIKCGLFGMSINIAAFIAGLDYSTPVNSSILIIISLYDNCTCLNNSNNSFIGVIDNALSSKFI